MKGSVKSIKLKYLLFLFVIILLVTLPVRVYQLFSIVETETGFYTTDDSTIVLLYVILGIFSAFTIGLSYLSAEIPSPQLPEAKNKLIGTASAILGVGLLWNVAGDIIAILKNMSAKISLIGEGLFSRIFSEQGGFVTIFKTVAAFLGAVYLFVFCVSHFEGKASYKDQKILAIMPMFWAMCSLITCLMQEISYIRISELMLEMCLYVFAMLFLMNFARVSSGIASEGVMWQIFGFGFPAALFGILVSVPRLVLFVMGREFVKDYPFDLSSLAMAAFAVIYIFASLGVGFGGAKEQKGEEYEEYDIENEDQAGEEEAERGEETHIIYDETLDNSAYGENEDASDETEK
ncbi:MAG: hypothetical protein BWY46_00460 [Firmicutes bacterium ADurb.Bin300]|nr:MAG: hypothetical protein BWY46_00460 [Firmicutes bacterium ADurb.Bin300]